MNSPSPVVMVCTVGGTPAPVRTSICHHRPSHVIYVASPQSRETIRKDIEEGLEWKVNDTQVVTLENYQDIVQCVQDMREYIVQALQAMSLPEDTPLIADITGGTKIMSAALALVMMEFKSRFSYVGGSSRTKGGLGIVESGTEFVVQDANPWDVLALREVRALANAFNHTQFADALRIAQELAKNMDGGSGAQKFYAAVADMVQAYMLWDSFDHAKALNILRQAHDRLVPYAAGNERIGNLLHALKQDVERLDVLQRDAAALRSNAEKMGVEGGRPYLLDLLGNARRCAEAGHYDDAVARLYSAIEKYAKVTLWSQHGIDNSRIPLDRVPESIREEWRWRADTEGMAKVGLQQSYQLLDALGDPLGKAFMEHADSLKKELASRNESLLAHGYVPIGREKYEKLMAVALNFLNVTEANLSAFPQIDWRALLLCLTRVKQPSAKSSMLRRRVRRSSRRYPGRRCGSQVSSH